MEDWKVDGYPLRVVETGTWFSVYQGRFQTRALAVSFFPDGRSLFLDFTPGKGQLTHQQIVVDLGTGKRIERMRSADPFRYFEQMFPVGDRDLLLARSSVGGHEPRHLERLARLEFPSYREVAHLELPAKRGVPNNNDAVGVSADRKLLFYFLENAIVCRRTTDLSGLATIRTEEGLTAFPTISARGDYFAASIAKGTLNGQFLHYTHLYISVYDRDTAAEIARLPIDGKEGIAISPDGKTLAVVVREPGQRGEVSPTVHIYDVASGTKLTVVVHDRIPKGRRQFLEAGCGVAFTSDGKYLITSGMLTKVWRIGE